MPLITDDGYIKGPGNSNNVIFLGSRQGDPVAIHSPNGIKLVVAGVHLADFAADGVVRLIGTTDLAVAGSVTSGAAEGNTTMGDGINFVFGTTTGTKIGTAITQKIGFFNATPVVQPAAAAQGAASAISGGESPTEAEHNAVVTLVNALRTALVDLGLIKGAA